MPEKYGDHISTYYKWVRWLYFVILCSWPTVVTAQFSLIQSLSSRQKVQYPVPEGVGDAWMEVARGYDTYSENELTQKIACYELAIPLYKMAANKLKQAMALQMLGDCYNHQGVLPPALSASEKALAVYKEIQYPSLQGIYDLLGNVNSQMGNYEIALMNGFMAVRTAEKQQDTSLTLCTIYNRLGLTFYHLADYIQALTYFKKSLGVARKWNDTTSILTLLPNVASTLQRLERPEEAIHILEDMEKRYHITSDEDKVTLSAGLATSYTSLGRYEEAYVRVKKLKCLSRKFGAFHYMQDGIYAAMINYFLAIKDYQNVKLYGKNYEVYCKKGGYAPELLNDYRSLFRADSALGNYPDAIVYYQQYKLLQDSLYGEEKTREIAQLQMQYDMERKDQDLLMKEQSIQLLTRKGLLQKSDLQRARLEGNVIIGGTLMLVILLVLGYNRYQLKQNINRQLHLQQREIREQHNSLHVLLYTQRKLVAEKEWLVKEIHHRVKDNLQIIMRLLNAQAAHLDDENALAAIHESRHRMQAISLIHQKLYSSESMAVVEMDIYIRELVAYFEDSFAGLQQISFDLQIADVYLEVCQAVPIGLILNEAITNSFKYAFPAGGEGTITVNLQYISEDDVLLSVKDNGNGLPVDFEKRRHASMGIILMETLSEQLEGKLSVKNKDGVSVFLIFKPQHNREKVPGLLKLVNKTA
ncbi:histidine kinase dimerization/phosphoacceptor domain -containing protein [Chitinophaga sp. CF418]|uniref:tetratricopeptide repeat-containing sensor histidine kinase n=1 Tax=Chitinophaga sp. CF418 TaxID=1855287 RepID=UPI00090FEA6D|nr:histidine kinase dimerization/phosphoacceptor domain -containing protein [Chitinophaga sp. CF418]SHN45794.1 Two-component sensor histidine kinase, contains HisKA and HATPase domains [Chitinophaga sp. CF418]